MDKRKIIVTSALPYANGALHLGHLVEYLQTDFWVRYQRMMGHDCVYVCADDTHGTPVMIRARQEGITPEALIARSYEARVKEFAAFEMGFDRYGSTNCEENRILSEQIYLRLKDKGLISTRPVSQLYCERCGMFLPDRFVKGTCPKCGAPDRDGDNCSVCGATYNPADLREPRCAICGGTPVPRASDQLFDLPSFLRRDCIPQAGSILCEVRRFGQHAVGADAFAGSLPNLVCNGVFFAQRDPIDGFGACRAAARLHSSRQGQRALLNGHLSVESGDLHADRR